MTAFQTGATCSGPPVIATQGGYFTAISGGTNTTFTVFASGAGGAISNFRPWQVEPVRWPGEKAELCEAAGASAGEELGHAWRFARGLHFKRSNSRTGLTIGVAETGKQEENMNSQMNSYLAKEIAHHDTILQGIDPSLRGLPPGMVKG